MGPYLPTEHAAKSLIKLDDAQTDLSCWFCHAAAHRNDFAVLVCSFRSFSNFISLNWAPSSEFVSSSIPL